MGEASHYIVLVELRALPAWLALNRRDRRQVVSTHVEPIFERHSAGCSVRWIDVESFTDRCSDVLIAELDDPRTWNAMWETVRDSPLFAVPYFDVESILFGIEDGYVEYEAALVDA